ncbi:MAG TPA: site-2 protease family protein [Ignavibacteriaceae bacterium]|nr:site-2 protease family protein [Ignavibacteriaceae bacterium]
MQEDKNYTYQVNIEPEIQKKEKQKYWLHIGLFVATFITTTIAGVQWTTGNTGPYDIAILTKGLPYSLSILFIIGCHEFGHYFAAVYHKVKATLPFFIPFPPIPFFLNFGTLGAVIKTKSPVMSKKAMFDIGIAGPIAGFIACLIVLVYGFTHIPGKEYILTVHPDYFTPDFGKNALELRFGDTLLFSFFKLIFVSKSQFFPPMSEIYHYPFLCVGWFGLFITSMNMIPVGQLDGGHIAYTMFGDTNHYKIAVVSFSLLFILGTLGILEATMDLGFTFGWSGWLFWALILFFFIKLKHPPIPDYETIGKGRLILGYFSFFILLISFSPSPFIVSGL